MAGPATPPKPTAAASSAMIKHQRILKQIAHEQLRQIRSRRGGSQVLSARGQRSARDGSCETAFLQGRLRDGWTRIHGGNARLETFKHAIVRRVPEFQVRRVPSAPGPQRCEVTNASLPRSAWPLLIPQGSKVPHGSQPPRCLTCSWAELATTSGSLAAVDHDRRSRTALGTLLAPVRSQFELSQRTDQPAGRWCCPLISAWRTIRYLHVGGEHDVRRGPS